VIYSTKRKHLLPLLSTFYAEIMIKKNRLCILSNESSPKKTLYSNKNDHYGGGDRTIQPSPVECEAECRRRV
jgi:hypothetical protein